MTRRFWFYEKKRGQRRTGSHKVASLGEGALFTALLVVGILGVKFIFDRLVVPEWRANRHYQETTATVLGTRVQNERDRDGHATYRPEVHVRYTVDGVELEPYVYDAAKWFASGYDQAQAALQPFEVGKQVECWYDPDDPSSAVVVRGYSGWLYLFLLIPASLLVIGGVGLSYTIYHFDTSAERRAMLTKKASEFDLFEAAVNGARRPACVPGDANLRNSPGTTLSFRLPTAAAPGWTLFATITAGAIWNVIAIVFVFLAVRKHLAGEPDYFLTAFAIPFATVGGLLVWFLVRQLLIATGVGPTRIEVSHHPLFPGGEYAMLLSQAGRLEIRSLQVVLACDEKATFHQGTDTRTELRRVFEQQVYQVDSTEVRPGSPLEAQCGLSIPNSAMHSFKATHNEILWKLVVRGTVVGWPDFERVFPIIVHPPSSVAHN